MQDLIQGFYDFGIGVAFLRAEEMSVLAVGPLSQFATYLGCMYLTGSGYRHSQPSLIHPAQDGLSLVHLTLRALQT
jgi:hypothetical protein